MSYALLKSFRREELDIQDAKSSSASAAAAASKLDPRIKKPMDVLKFYKHWATPAQRANLKCVFQLLAEEMYKNEPVFLKRQLRAEAKVWYNLKTDKIHWLGGEDYVIPNSRLWKSTESFETDVTAALLQQREEEEKEKERWKPSYLGKVILVLMVKNEGLIIERMIQSIVKDIDGFVILDTGSTDTTKEILWDHLVIKHKKKGHIFIAPFYDFGANRTILVQLAHNSGDWLLLSDADYQWRASKPQWREALTDDTQQYHLSTVGDTRYTRPHIVRGAVLWCYTARTHEFLGESVHNTFHKNMGGRRTLFQELKLDHIGDGQSKNDKGPRDIVLLLMDQMDYPEDSRTPFYLGNSYKNIGMFEAALESYEKHQFLKGWKEEQGCAQTGILDCRIHLGHNPLYLIEQGLEGILVNPERLETLNSLLTLTYQPVPGRSWNRLFVSLCGLMMHTPYPAHHTLFVEKSIHDWVFWQRFMDIYLGMMDSELDQIFYFEVMFTVLARLQSFLQQEEKEEKEEKNNNNNNSSNSSTEEKIKNGGENNSRKDITSFLPSSSPKKKNDDLDKKQQQYDYYVTELRNKSNRWIQTCVTNSDVDQRKKLYDYGIVLKHNQQYQLAKRYFMASTCWFVPKSLLENILPVRFEEIFTSMVLPRPPPRYTVREFLHALGLPKLTVDTPYTSWSACQRTVLSYIVLLQQHHGVIQTSDESTKSVFQYEHAYVETATNALCHIYDLNLLIQREKWDIDTLHVKNKRQSQDYIDQVASLAYLFDGLKLNPRNLRLLKKLKLIKRDAPNTLQHTIEKIMMITEPPLAHFNVSKSPSSSSSSTANNKIEDEKEKPGLHHRRQIHHSSYLSNEAEVRYAHTKFFDSSFSSVRYYASSSQRIAFQMAKKHPQQKNYVVFPPIIHTTAAPCPTIFSSPITTTTTTTTTSDSMSVSTAMTFSCPQYVWSTFIVDTNFQRQLALTACTTRQLRQEFSKFL